MNKQYWALSAIASTTAAASLFWSSAQPIAQVNDYTAELTKVTGGRQISLVAPSPTAPLQAAMGFAIGGWAIFSLARAIADDAPGQARQSIGIPTGQPANPAPVTPNRATAPGGTPGEEIPVSALEEQSETYWDFFARLMLDDSGLPVRQHYRLMGATRAGKTVLGEHLIRRIQGNRPAQKFLINPKHRASNPSWSIPPFAKSIEQALKALQHLENLLKQRIEDKNFNPESEPLIFVICDEWDWIFEVYKADALASLRALFKVGAELGVYVVLLGQSPLSKDSGLSQSDNQNFAQIVIGAEALKLLAGSSFYQDNREELRQQASRLHADKQRFALIVPREGPAYISAIPQLEKPKRQPPKFETPETTDCKEREELTEGQAKLAFMFSLPSETPQHEQPLAPHLQAILEYARRQNSPVTAREIQQATIKNVQGLGAEQIRQAFNELAQLGKGETGGEGAKQWFSSF